MHGSGSNHENRKRMEQDTDYGMDVQKYKRRSRIVSPHHRQYLKGLADDGGLYVPEQIPALDIPLAEELAKMNVSGDRIRRYEPFSH